MATDGELLAEFAQRRSDEAFAELARRYTNLVHAAARRQTPSAAMADDVTQAVFLVLARKAASVPAARLAAWLLTVTRLCAKDANRKEIRRTHHEREAAMARSEIDAPAKSFDPQIAVHLDDAIARLRSRDATAIALRFLQNKPVNEVAVSLGVSPNAAQKILARALLKLRKILSRRGVSTASSAILSGTLLHEAAHVAPATLAISPAAASQTSGHAIASGVIHMMLRTKLKIAAAVTATSFLLAGAGVVGVMHALADSQVAPDAPVSPPPAAVPAPPVSVAPFDSPFLQLVGCRIKQPIALKLSAQPGEHASITAVAQQYSVAEWTIDPALAAAVANFNIAIVSTNDPAGAQTLHADKSAASLPLVDLLSQPGEYDVTISAVGSDAKPLASASAHLTLNPMPMTQIMINDLQADGSLHFTTVIQSENNSGRRLTRDGFINSDFVHIEKMTNDRGEPLQFTASHQGNIFRYQVTVKPPIEPGDPVLMSNSGTETGMLRDMGKGVWSYSFTHTPGGSSPTRRIELYRLPEGATLIYASGNMQSKTIDGRIQLYMETTIPVDGSNSIAFRYRLPAAQ